MPRSHADADAGGRCEAEDGAVVGPKTAALAALGTLVAAGTALAVKDWQRRRRARGRGRHADVRAAARIAALARVWAARDPDPVTRATVATWAAAARASSGAVIDGDGDDNDDDALARLDEARRLRFGTAGLRAEMGPGYDRMNIYNVVVATQAVLSVMRRGDGGNATTKSSLQENGVAIGFDGRHSSERFALAAAAVFVAAQVKVRLFSRPVPTPLVAFAVVHYGLAGSIVITASHNPPADNGYKLYWSDGAQIRPPRDAQIEEAMRTSPDPWMSYDFDPVSLRASPFVSDPLDACLDAYVLRAAMELKWRTDEENSSTNPVVYTACHGVGYPYVSRMFQAFGLPPVIPVDEQTLVPNPDFPTLPKPNPEESGAMDLAIAVAKARGARLVLANDPDADRLGVAEVDSETGEVRVFSGDETAVLLADYLLERYPKEGGGDDGGGGREKLAMVASTVSSKMLASMARREGFLFVEGLTGFKWLSQTAADVKAQHPGMRVVLAYEEAIGFMLGDVVRDKDGVTAAAVCAEMGGFRYGQGTTLRARFKVLCGRYGYHVSCNGYLRLPKGSTPLRAIFARARAGGCSGLELEQQQHGQRTTTAAGGVLFPTRLGDCVVVSVRDLTRGTDTGRADGRAVLPRDASTEFLTFTCRSPLSRCCCCPSAGTGGQDPGQSKEDVAKEGFGDLPDVVISLRGSGTEPKVKHYGELRCGEEHFWSGAGARTLRLAVADAIEQVLRPREHGLEVKKL